MNTTEWAKRGSNMPGMAISNMPFRFNFLGQSKAPLGTYPIPLATPLRMGVRLP